MASVLDLGGFAVEALPALREGVELALRSWEHCLGADALREEDVPLTWVQDHLPDHLSLVVSLRKAPEVPLVEEEAAHRWIREATHLVEQIEREVRSQGQDAETETKGRHGRG